MDEGKHQPSVIDDKVNGSIFLNQRHAFPTVKDKLALVVTKDLAFSNLGISAFVSIHLHRVGPSLSPQASLASTWTCKICLTRFSLYHVVG